MDGLDELLAEAAAERAEKRRDSAKPAKPTPARMPAPSGPPTLLTREASSAAKGFYSSLKSYIERLLDPDVLDGIDADFRSRTFFELEEYLGNKSELAAYMLKHELGRMSYSLVGAAGGPALTEAASIREEYARHEASGSPADAELLWRAANQSLLAEPLGSLQAAWLEPSLHTCIVATSSRFELDLRAPAPQLRAECTLAVQTLGAGDEPLLLSTACVTIEVSPAERMLRQSLSKPRLADCCIYDEQIVATAEAMAQWEAAARSGGTGASPKGTREGDISIDHLTAQLEHFLQSEDELPGGGDVKEGGTGLLGGLTNVTSGILAVLGRRRGPADEPA
eukprot:scaffold643_cov217-Isochrysis_galbana.AAC.2